jgi:hypothetical protein
MSRLELSVDGTQYSGDLLDDAAPESVAALETFLPHESELMHVRWSGHAVWVNIDEVKLPELPRENHTVYPSRGDVLLYPGFRNEQEILLACGPTCFKSPAGELAGNHVATLDADAADLRQLEELTLQDGVQDVAIRMVE